MSPSVSKLRHLAAELEKEKKGTADLQEVVNSQSNQMDELTGKVQEAVKERADMEVRIHELTRIVEQER